MANVAADVYIEGIVQGVGFRNFAFRKAYQFGVNGYAKNLRDGRVLIYAEGDQECVDRFLVAIRRGPPGAHVRSMQLEQKPYTGRYGEFTIMFDL